MRYIKRSKHGTARQRRAIRLQTPCLGRIRAASRFAPTQADLIAKKIGMVSGQLYATSAYLTSIGNPSKPTEFGQASFIGFEDNHQYLNFLKGCGFVDLTARNFQLTTDNRIVQWELVKQGLGIGVMQESVGDAERAVTRAPAPPGPCAGGDVAGGA